MTASQFYDGVKFNTATTNTGTITVTSAFLDAANGDGLTPAARGVPDGTTVSYYIADGHSWESGQGVTGSSGTTLTRDAGCDSSSGTGVKISLSGTAVVEFVARSADLSALGPPSTSGQSAGAALVVNASGAAAWGPPNATYVSNVNPRYIYPDTVTSNDTTSTGNVITGRIYLFPLSTPMVASMIAFQVTTAGAGGTTARLGLYGSNADGSPGALIEEATSSVQVDCTTTGIKQVNFAANHNISGRVWLALAVSATVGVRCGAASERSLYLSGTSKFGNNVGGDLGAGSGKPNAQTGFTDITSYAALPSTLPGLSSLSGLGGSASNPIIVLG